MKTDVFCRLIREHVGEPSAIYDVGAFDGDQTLELAQSFPQAAIIGFECDPQAFETCRIRCQRVRNIRIFPVAANNNPYDIVSFFRATTGNRQYGSLIVPIGNFLEPMPHSLISVPAMRLEDAAGAFGLPSPDAMWLDVQGTESDAILGLGTMLKSVRLICAEVNYSETYSHQMLRDEFNSFMLSLGFENIKESVEAENWFGNACYLNSKCTKRIQSVGPVATPVPEPKA